MKCLSCGKEFKSGIGWWHFTNYPGKHGLKLQGKFTLSGGACGECSRRIYDEPGFYESCVAAQQTEREIS